MRLNIYCKEKVNMTIFITTVKITYPREEAYHNLYMFAWVDRLGVSMKFCSLIDI